MFDFSTPRRVAMRLRERRASVHGAWSTRLGGTTQCKLQPGPTCVRAIWDN
jgi:hypothetical protein